MEPIEKERPPKNSEGKEVSLATCPRCEGAGTVDIQCPFCQGQGIVTEACPECQEGIVKVPSLPTEDGKD